MQVTDYSMIAQLTKEFLGSGASAFFVWTCLDGLVAKLLAFFGHEQLWRKWNTLW